MAEPALEFVWVGDDAIDPLEQAQTLQILVGAGIKTREEARADLGLRQRRLGASSGNPSRFRRLRTKREHFLDRLRRSWHSHLQWEKWRRRSGPALPRLLQTNSVPCAPVHRASFACFLRSLHVRSRPVPAARQGRSRPAPRHRRRDGGDARSLGRDFRLRLEQALFREMVRGSRGGERRQIARRRSRHAHSDRRRQADRHRLRRRRKADHGRAPRSSTTTNGERFRRASTPASARAAAM